MRHCRYWFPYEIKSLFKKWRMSLRNRFTHVSLRVCDHHVCMDAWIVSPTHPDRHPNFGGPGLGPFSRLPGGLLSSSDSISINSHLCFIQCSLLSLVQWKYLHASSCCHASAISLSSTSHLLIQIPQSADFNIFNVLMPDHVADDGRDLVGFWFMLVLSATRQAPKPEWSTTEGGLD